MSTQMLRAEIARLSKEVGDLVDYLPAEEIAVNPVGLVDTKPAIQPQLIEPVLVVYVDAGHGGNHPETGRYMTNPAHGKKYTFTNVSPNLEIREGVINRLIANHFCSLLSSIDGVEVVKVYEGYLDSSSTERARIANTHWAKVEAENKRTGRNTKGLYLSFHSNAMGMSSHGAGTNHNGVCWFTTRGTTRADKVADIWYEEHLRFVGDGVNYLRDLSDGDADYEADFDVLFFTKMPAVLMENLFFTNYEDALKLLDVKYQVASGIAAHNMVMRVLKERVLW